MKILMTSTGSWGTGSFMVIKAMMKEMEKMGHEIRVLFPDKPDLVAEDQDLYYKDKRFILWPFPLVSENGLIHVDNFPLMLGDPNPRNPDTLVLKNLSQEQYDLYFESFRKKSQEVVLDFKPDVIECHHIWMMNQVISDLGYPVIACAHNSDQIGFEQDQRMQPIGKSGAQSADYIFCVSDQVNQKVKKLYDLDKSQHQKIITITNGYDDSMYMPKEINREEFLKKHNLSIPDHAFIISFVGKLSKTKGFDILLEANKLLIERDSNNRYDFLIFGAGKLADVIDEKDLKYSQEHVHYMGHQSADVMCEANNIAKVGIFPSRSEGFPIAPLESMGCGLPVVLTRCGAPESFAVNELIDIESAQQLVDSIRKICNLSDSDYQKEKDKSYRKSREFTWHEIAEQRLKYYESMPKINYK